MKNVYFVYKTDLQSKEWMIYQNAESLDHPLSTFVSSMLMFVFLKRKKKEKERDVYHQRTKN